MDYTLIPICSESGHAMTVKLNCHYLCDVCCRHGVYYQCIDCEERRCKSCLKGYVKANAVPQDELDSSTSQNYQLSITIAQNKLDSDNLHDWSVKFSSSEGEIYYYHEKKKSITYDYPNASRPPPSPREDGHNISPHTGFTLESPQVRRKSYMGESVCDIYNRMKHRIRNLNLY